MELKDLIGKEMLGFEFEGGSNPYFVQDMKEFVGKKGKIIRASETSCSVKFPNAYNTWSYPYPQVLEHLIENQKDQYLLYNHIFSSNLNL